MDRSLLLVLVSVAGTLVTVAAIGGTALLAGAYMGQRARLQAAEQRNVQLESELADLKRYSRNKLFRGAMGDFGFAARQSIVRLRAMQAEFDSEVAVITKMLNLTPKE